MTNPANERSSEMLGTLGFGLVAAVLLQLQIIYSRLFAGTMTHYYAFLLISLAMLGLASGGLAVQLFPAVWPEDRRWTRAGAYSAALCFVTVAGCAGILALLGRIRFDDGNLTFVSEPRLLIGIFWCCFPAFLLGGTVVSGILGGAGGRFHRFYAVDLLSAALGCVAALVLLHRLTPVVALVTAIPALSSLASALFFAQAKRTGWSVGALVAGALVSIGGAVWSSEPAVGKPVHVAWWNRTEVVSSWSASSVVRVYKSDQFYSWGLSPRYSGARFPMLELVIDGVGASQIVEFDGSLESLQRYDYLQNDLTALPLELTPASSRHLVIGPGGGVDVLQAVRAGRRDLTLVEINPLVVDIVNERLASFSGRPYHLPGVRHFVENGRTFVKRSQENWDVLSLTWVDVGGSATALAFSENYLYTVEAFREYLDRLSANGLVSFLRAWDTGIKGLRVDSLRGVAVAVEALLAEGVADPGRHLLVASVRSPFFPRAMCLVLVKKSPFTASEIERAEDFAASKEFQLIWLPDRSISESDIEPGYLEVARVLRSVIEGPDRKSIYRDSIFDLAPSTDDNPFYFVERAGRNRSAGEGVRHLRLYVVVLASLTVPFLGLPLLRLLRTTGAPDWGSAPALGYFSLLGISFMLVEVEFFHLFALLLGKPTLTMATVLSSLLVSSGIGSLCAARAASGTRAELGGAFLSLVLGLAAFVAFGPRLLDWLVALPLALRVAGTIAGIAPIGFLMGIPMAAGMHLIRDRREIVLWGWALNGAFSVFASVAAIYMSIHVGISRTFLVGVIGYLLAGLLALRLQFRANLARAA